MSKLDPIIKKIESLDLNTLKLVPWWVHTAEERYGNYRKLYHTFLVPIGDSHNTTFSLEMTVTCNGPRGYNFDAATFTIELPNDVRFFHYQFTKEFIEHVRQYAGSQEYECDADEALKSWGFL